jgi:DNA polymerase III alpha subunit (gram-positive type)
MIKTFAFLDLETTGLPTHESNLTRITELCIVACSTQHFKIHCQPRVVHKLSMCFNPCRNISKISAQITGLTDELLKDESEFSENSGNVLVHFLQQLPQPVCLVAHNGNNFDYPILKAHLMSVNKYLPDTIMCCDSLKIFRETNSKWKKFSLSLIYRRLFGVEPPNAHNAESDVIALINCALKDKLFLETAQRCATSFEGIVPLVPN